MKTSFRRFDEGNGFFGLELPVLPFASRCRLIERMNHLWCSCWLRRLDVDVVIATNPVALPWLPRNVRFHGAIPHAHVLAQARASDVLVIPFARNDLIEGVDPVKMYEYLAAGRPIVSSWWPLMDKFRSFDAVRFYDADHSFEQQVLSALEGPHSYAPPKEFLRESDWARRLDDFDRILSARLCKKTAGLSVSNRSNQTLPS